MAAAAGELEIFLVATPGLEGALADEARERGFAGTRVVPGGVTVRGGWPEAWRANLVLRGAGRVLVKVAEFRALHLAQLDKRARRIPWGEVLRPDAPFRVEATCRASRIYHSGAAAQRVERAIRETVGAVAARDATVGVRMRIDDDLCTISVDTSGEALYKRGWKQAVAKAPLRETMAALLLRLCGFDGRESVLDPMCGSGTFVIEAAEMAAGLAPGRARPFAFEQLAMFDAAAWQRLRERTSAASAAATVPPGIRFLGCDRDVGAVRMSEANAARAGVAHLGRFQAVAVESLQRPQGAPGLVIVNPPYGERVGAEAGLRDTYRALGRTLASRFAGWRVGLVTSDAALAAATGLPFGLPSPPISHGGLRIMLWRTAPLA